MTLEHFHTKTFFVENEDRRKSFMKALELPIKDERNLYFILLLTFTLPFGNVLQIISEQSSVTIQQYTWQFSLHKYFSWIFFSNDSSIANVYHRTNLNCLFLRRKSWFHHTTQHDFSHPTFITYFFRLIKFCILKEILFLKQTYLQIHDRTCIFNLEQQILFWYCRNEFVVSN